MVGYGIIQADGSVIEEDGTVHYLPFRGTDDEDYPEVLMDAKAVGGDGFFHRQSIKPFIGWRVSFIRNYPNTQPFNHIVLPKT